MRASRQIAIIAASLVAAMSNTARGEDAKSADAVRVAKEALSRELDIDVKRMDVATVEPVEWRDGSLGCPRKGMTYTQALSAGYRVLLSVGNVTYPVHVAGERAVVCTQSTTTPKTGAGDNAVAAIHVADLARQHLADRLHMEVSDITIASVRSWVWPNPGLECPGQGGADPPVGTTQGYVIDLSVGSKNYIYHASDTGARLCAIP
jgi:hypothetical protein